jgi:hypothetical protein
MMAIVRGERGTSILEAVVALSITLIALSGTMGLFSIGFKSSISSAHLTTALNAARAKLEEIKGTEFSRITTVYPDGSTYPVPNLNGGTLRVEYPNGTSSNPLVISVSVAWQEGEVVKEINLMTMVSSP